MNMTGISNGGEVRFENSINNLAGTPSPREKCAGARGYTRFQNGSSGIWDKIMVV